MEPISSHRGDVHAREASAGAEGSAEDATLSRDEKSAVAQEAVAQEAVAQEAVAQEAVAQEAVAQEAAPQEAAPQEAGFGDDIGAHGALSPEAEASFSLFARDDTDESDEATLIKTRKCGDEEERTRERERENKTNTESLKRHTSSYLESHTPSLTLPLPPFVTAHPFPPVHHRPFSPN